MSNSASKRSRCAARLSASLLLAAALDGLFCAQRACAVTRTWVGGTSGSWSISGNWNPSGVPASGDTAIIPSVSNFAGTNVTYDYTGPAVTLADLQVSRSALGTFFSTLTIAANNLSASQELVGDSTGSVSGRGAVNQSGGTNTASSLFLGIASIDIGDYDLSGNGVLSASPNGSIYVGVSGTGSFNQSGGAASTFKLDLANGTGSRGTYTLSGGSLTVDGMNSTVRVGDAGSGTFNQSGGRFVHGGGAFAVGVAGAGTYIMSGGTLSTSELEVGDGPTAQGTFSLSNTAWLEASPSGMSVGNGGIGVFSQGGGTISMTGGSQFTTLQLGSHLGSGDYTLGGGMLLAHGTEYIGSAGTGTFTQNGGTHSISGFFGQGTGSALIIGNSLGSSGVYSLNAGTLSVTDGNEYAGLSGAGTFTQSGGLHAMSGSGFLSIGAGSGSTGVYNLVGGTFSSTSVYVGGDDSAAGGTGSLIVASGATLTVGGTLKAWNAGYVKLASPTRVGVVTTQGNGKIDLTNSAMVVDYAPGPSPIASVRALLVSGYAGGAWNGPGINSSIAAIPANLNKTAVGYAEAADLFSSFPANFAGLSADSSSVLLRYTLYGDANLDGTVDTLDFNALAGHFGATGERWSHGDFNYDGVIDTLDFNSLSANFGLSLPTETGVSAIVMVPEPGAMMLLSVLALGLPMSRSRHLRDRRCHVMR